MFITKIFDTSLTISNPINFCVNKKNHCLTELNNIYLKKCFMGSYIIKINDILRISSCKIVSSNSSAAGVINVQFSATTFILNSWDILVGAVVEKNNSLIVGHYVKDGVNVYIALVPTDIPASSLVTKQLIPVRILKPGHMPKDDKITAAAILLTCDKKAGIFKVKGRIQQDAMPEIQLLLDNIKEELLKRTELLKTRKEDVIFFESLIYSYSNSSREIEAYAFKDYVWYGPKASKNKDLEFILHNIFELIENNEDMTGLWSRPLNIYRSSPYIAKITSNVNKQDTMLSLPHIVILDFLKNIYVFLTAIREFVEIYNTKELKESHNNIWTIMKQVQIQN